MARTKADGADDADQMQANPTEMIRVIVQRPHGTTDSHAFFGFNGIEGQYAYDKPVMMPRNMVDHLRNARVVEWRPNEAGEPVASYVNAFSIVDA